MRYKGNSIELDLIKLASEGDSNIQIQDGITFNKCQDMVQSQPITFTTPESFIRLPHWEVGRLGGTMTFTFQTNEPRGVMMYNSRQKNSDFFAFELWDGYLWFIIDLGSGPQKIRVSPDKVNDGLQHRIILEHHNTNAGYIMLDGRREDYIVKGQSTDLNLDGELFVGGLGDGMQQIPKDLWSGVLGYGYIGCFQDLELNQVKIDLLTPARKNMKSGVTDTCRKMQPQCIGRPCYHGGKCTEGWNRYVCDCRSTPFTGSSCQAGMLFGRRSRESISS